MRKILIMVLILVLIILGYFAIVDGLSVFGIKVLSIQGIKEKSENLNLKLEQVSTLTSAEYPLAISNLKESSKQLLLEKSNYADLVTFSSSDDITAASQLEKYEMEYLWAKIGNHATKNGIVLKFDVKTSSMGTPNVYDLYFTANGKYVSISEFIAAIEEDSSLEFKIEDFKLLPYSVNSNNDTNNLQATFTVKDISINIDKISENNQNTMNDTSITDTNNPVDTSSAYNSDQVGSVTGDIQNSVSNDINYSNNN